MEAAFGSNAVASTSANLDKGSSTENSQKDASMSNNDSMPTSLKLDLKEQMLTWSTFMEGNLNDPSKEGSSGPPMSIQQSMRPDFILVDPNEGASFVVLGKDSMESIHTKSMASYVQIQQKSESVDHTSMISSLSPVETEKLLNTVLQENTKLKETLAQNNLAMKKQFHTLATWQEEVSKVLRNQKQKFAETRELISHLKAENADLKMKISINSDVESKIDASAVVRELELVNEITTLKKELNECKTKCGRMNQEIERYVSLMNSMTLQLKQATKTISDQQQALNLIESTKEKVESSDFNFVSASTFDKNKEQEKELNDLKIYANTLEKELESIKKSYFAPIELQVGVPEKTPSDNRQQFIFNVKQYEEKLKALAECYSDQSLRFIKAQNCLKVCTDILEVFKGFDFSTLDLKDTIISVDEINMYKNKLSENWKLLMDEQLEFIASRQMLIKAQNQFQKVFSDYNSVLYEMEVLIEENNKLNTLQKNITQENLEKMREHNRKAECDQKMVADQKKILLEEQEKLEDEKKSLETLRKSLIADREDILMEKELLQQEKMSLRDEKTSLDHQTQVYEKLYEEQNRGLQAEKKLLQQQCENFVVELNHLKELCQKKNAELEACYVKLSISDGQVDEIQHLRQQLEIFENDFKEERAARQLLKQEKDEMENHLSELLRINEASQQNLDLSRVGLVRRNSANTEPPGTGNCFCCPKCTQQFSSLSPLSEHVEVCLGLH